MWKPLAAAAISPSLSWTAACVPSVRPSPREISGLFTVAIETENTNDFGEGILMNATERRRIRRKKLLIRDEESMWDENASQRFGVYCESL